MLKIYNWFDEKCPWLSLYIKIKLDCGSLFFVVVSLLLYKLSCYDLQ